MYCPRAQCATAHLPQALDLGLVSTTAAALLERAGSLTPRPVGMRGSEVPVLRYGRANAGWSSSASKWPATPLMAGLSIAAAAFVGKQAVQQYVKYMASPGLMKPYYKGGFLSTMTRREASLILGLRESAAEEKIKDAHRKIMIANHPDAGGSSFIAAKVNEAKDMLLGKKKPGGAERECLYGENQGRPLKDHDRQPSRCWGSSFIAAKVNEAKDILLGKKMPGGSVS
eukprot:gene2673-12776_t